MVAGYVDRNKGGKVLVCGSLRMFSDDFLNNEDNCKILNGMMRYLGTNDIQLNDVKRKEDNDTVEYNRVPDTAALASKVRS